MKMLEFEISGYKKILTGIGLERLRIDFSKSTNPICLIVGPNGSGKSSLEEAMHPLPDSNDNFIDGRPAYKKITYDNGYSIYIDHPVNERGIRQQSKAYIKKRTVDGVIELNPNGNITSYKELLESELEIDGSFVALSRLSSEDRGMADKRPAERKKFLNTIVPNMDVYNAINKTIVKRSTIFKSMINSLTTKIDNIGDPEQLKSTFISLNNRINKLEAYKNEIVASISENEAKIKIIDPDTSIQKLYEEVSKELELVNNDLSRIDIEVYKSQLSNRIENLSFDIESLSSYYKKFNDIKTKYTTDIESLNERINDLLIDREEDVKIIQIKTEKMNMLTADLNIEELENRIKYNESILEEAYKVTSIIGIDPKKVSKDEFLSGLNVLEDIQSIVNNFLSGVDLQVLTESIRCIRENINPIDIVKHDEENIEYYSDKLEELKEQFRTMSILESKVSILDNRPSNCNDDSCYFIKDAVEASKVFSKEDLNKIAHLIKSNEDLLSSLKIKLEQSKQIVECYNSIQVIIRNITNYSNILKKLPYGDIYSNPDAILSRLEVDRTFEEISIMSNWKDNANILETIRITEDTLYKLNADYSVYKSKNSVIDELSNEIDSLNIKLNEVSKSIEERKSRINDLTNKIIQIQDTLSILDSAINLLKTYNSLLDKKNDCQNKINTVQSNMDIITAAIDNINNLNQVLNNTYAEIKELSNDRDKIKYSLSVLEDYKAELKEYQEKYEVVETIKYYSSPSTGIQTLFIKLYMANTLNLANTLLSNLFEGELVLEPYIIDENNFRIPVINGGMYIDDISSCSTAQKSLIAMILSFTMLKQSSGVFNILRLDEIDGGLDTNNRIQFMTVLKELMNILSVDQLIMVSHNNELSTEDVDIILLKDTGVNYNNVIWRNE